MIRCSGDILSGRCIRMSNMAYQYVAALLIVGLLGLNQAAVAQGPGTGCIFNAPTGATTSLQISGATFGHAGPAGHVGWAITDVGGQWHFGATENGGGSFLVPSGGNTQTWLAAGTQTDMLAAFMTTGNFHLAGYYTRWRCIDVSISNVTAALQHQAIRATSGFNGLWDNCLTKAVEILNAYGDMNSNNDLAWYPKLYPGWWSAPNTYFDDLSDAGWGPVNYLNYPAGIGCMFNAPSGATTFGHNLGHVGWGFFDSGTGNWTFGATEDRQGNMTVPVGGDAQSWIASGSVDDMYSAFKNAGYFHPSGYYQRYLCSAVTNGYVGAALEMEVKVASSGYNAVLDNCLTKAVAILSAYGESSLFYPGYLETPNFYFEGLTGVGWGLINIIP